MDFLPESFRVLKNYPQFILYKVSRKGEKYIKKPVDPRTKTVHNALDSEIWMSEEDALKELKALDESYGLGFVLTEEDPFFFLDIDHCLTPEGWSPLAGELCSSFPGAAVEVSTSKTGLHILGRSEKIAHRNKNIQLNIELYTSKRFIALTGTSAQGDMEIDCTESLKGVVAQYFAPPSAPVSSVTPKAAHTENAELIELALSSESVKKKMGKSTSASFKELWTKDSDALARYYPADSNTSPEAFNESSADAALAQHLAFWTGKDQERIHALMWESELRREKWDREDYLPRTIQNACEQCKNVYSKTPAASGQSAPKGSVPSGRLLDISEQQEFFKGCTYIRDENSILIPGGEVLDKERFKTMYGRKSFILDPVTSKITRNAWDAFTLAERDAFPMARGATYLPQETPGKIIERGRDSFVNSYWPADIEACPGDITPFLTHLKKLLPIAHDREIALNYLAAMTQFKGIKFQWCPVFQGVPGNGKTFLSWCVANAIGREHSQFPSAEGLTSRFNDWQYGCIGAFVEDFYIPGSKIEGMETLKPMITAKWLMLEGKGKKKIMRDVCCNYIINTNHKGAMKKEEGDRRFAIFFTAQQSPADLSRDGMLGEYGPNLYGWAENKGGFAHIAHYLLNYSIKDEFNPLICTRAPQTSTTHEAIIQSMGVVESEIMEAVGQHRIGFRNGWINSNALNALLTECKLANRVPSNRRRDLLLTLGYDWHPALPSGRVTTVVPGDTSRPKLYLTTDHKGRSLSDPREIAALYLEDQKENS